jgi:ABC-type uncharacterized transport system involved in gliding motility auxiliary subunit
MREKKQFETFLYSAVGVAVMFLIVIAIYTIAGVFKVRVDLTQEKLYTLSPGTKAILEKLDTPVEVRFYYTMDSKDMPVMLMDSKDMPIMLKTYAEQVEDLLNEYRKHARGNITIRKMDPKPDSDAEESANMDGIEGQVVSLGSDRIYLGLSISQLDVKVALPFLSPKRERLLEYDISRAIARVVSPAKPVIGVMTPLPAFGEINPMAMRMGQMQQQDPWVFISELKRDFDVRRIEMTSTQIPEELQVLVVVHPKGISDAAQYAIDQFLLRGGKLIAFLDPLSVVDSPPPGMNPLQAAQIPGSNMEKLLNAWGVNFDISKVAADVEYMTRINRGSGPPEEMPAVLSLTSEAVDKDDVVTSQIDSILMAFSGVFTGTPADGLKKTVLAKTSKNSQLIERFMAEFSSEQTRKDFVRSDKEHALAIRLTGRFKTAFPEGKPVDSAHKHDDDDDHDHDHAQEQSGPDNSLKESAKDGMVVLVGDADMLHNNFSVRVQDFFGQRFITPFNGNLGFVQNLVEQAAGDSNLIAVRSRATMNRPFTVVRSMQADAEERFRNKIKELEQSLTTTQNRLNELQKSRESGQRFILTDAQQEEIRNFRKKEAEAKKELKEVRRNLRRDIDSLENRVKWINIAAMPFLVTISGIGLAFIKRKKTAAK